MNPKAPDAVVILLSGSDQMESDYGASEDYFPQCDLDPKGIGKLPLEPEETTSNSACS